jgi:hypothetical protein
VKFAFADPVYLGCARLYAKHHPEAHVWNDPETHRGLVQRLCAEYPDGWAMSCSTPSLRVLLPFTPEDCRIGSWVKPFAVFKPNVNPAYAWEPVIFRGGRKRDRTQPTARDWHSENITLKKGLPGPSRRSSLTGSWLCSAWTSRPATRSTTYSPARTA